MKIIFFLFPEKSHSAEKGLARKNTSSQGEFSYESEGVPFDQMKVSGKRRTEAKKMKKRYFPQLLRNASVQQDQKYQRGHPQASGNMFPLQKTRKTKTNSFLFYFGMSHSAEKTMWPYMLAKRFPLKIGGSLG